jgi:hypothetical protein
MSSQRPKKNQRKLEPKRKRRERRKHKLIQGPLDFGGPTLVLEPRGIEKMSEVLEDFVEPYMHSAETEDDFHKLLTLAVIAWNAALLPDDKSQAIVDDVLGKGLIGASVDEMIEARNFVNAMIERKKAYFATNKRAIISFNFQDTGTGYHLSVASTLEVPPAP